MRSCENRGLGQGHLREKVVVEVKFTGAKGAVPQQEGTRTGCVRVGAAVGSAPPRTSGGQSIPSVGAQLWLTACSFLGPETTRHIPWGSQFGAGKARQGGVAPGP